MVLGQVHLHHGRTVCKRPETYSDAEALDKGDVILAFFPFAFFSDSQCLATSGAETPGEMNICYKGAWQSCCLDAYFVDQLWIILIVGGLVDWLVGCGFFNNISLQKQGKYVSQLPRQISPDYQKQQQG